MGNVCAITDQSGNTETFRYDREGRETEHTDRNGTVTRTKYNVYGKLLNKWSSGRKALSCTYYRDGSLKRQTDISGKTVLYEYDENGRLKCLKEKDGGVLTEYRYTNAGRIKEILMKNGIHTTYAYDEDGNVSRLTIGDGTEGACFTTPSCFTT